MKKITALLMILFLAACGKAGTSSGGESPAKPAPIAPQPPQPMVELKWGQLKCQRSMSCKNSVLNAGRLDLIDFLETKFREPLMEGASRERRQFACGKKSVELWYSRFSTRPDRDESEIGNFLIQFLNITSCVRINDLEDKLTNYFKNTEEYINEIH